MSLPLPYGLIKDLYNTLSKYSSKELKSNYDNFKFLKDIGINTLDEQPLTVYYNALYNFTCLGYNKEWSYILSEKDVIESYEKEFIDYESHEGNLREVIDSQLHTNRNIIELKNCQFIDDKTYNAFLDELEKAELQQVKKLPYRERKIYQRIVHDIPKKKKRENILVEKAILRYLHKAKKRLETTGEQINKFYIEVLGEKVELEISATEYWEELDFSEEETESELQGSIEPISDKVTILAKNIPRLFLRGNPGTGKTTSLNKIYYENILSALNNIPNSKIPLLIEAKNYSQKGDINVFILKSFELEKDYFDNLMNNPDLLIMIDGLNEIKPDLIYDAKKEIRELIEDYPKPFYLLTSRRYNFESYKIEDSQNLELKIYDIRPLDEKDIRDYIGKHTNKNIERGKEIWQQIKRNTNIRQLVTNPMYLRMILAVAAAEEGERKRIPQSKGELYHKFMSKLLAWEAKQIMLGDTKIKLHINTKIKYISHLAYHMILERTIPEEKVINILDSQIHDYNTSILFLDELRHNYLVKQVETGNLSFVHDTYSEYFAAVWLNKYFEVNNELPIDFREQQWFEPILMCSDIFRNPDLLNKYLSYLLIGGNKKRPIKLNGKWNFADKNKSPKLLIENSITAEVYNSHLSVGCSVAYNIFMKTNRKDKEKYFKKAEETLSNYLVFWLNHYLNTGREIIPAENIFAAVGALSSRTIFNTVFCEIDWMSIWGKLDFYPIAESSKTNHDFYFNEIEKKQLDEISKLSLHAFINNLNDFTMFYFFLVKEIPRNKKIYKIFEKEFTYLKNKLLSDTAKSNIELMKYFFSNTNDYDVLKKIGDRDVDFYLNSILKIKVDENEVSGYLRNHPLMNIEEKLKYDQLKTLQEKIDSFRKARISQDSNISDNLATAKEFEAINNYEEAKKYFLKVLNLSPTNAASLSFLVKYFKNNGNYKEGIRILKQAEKPEGATGFIISNIGEFYQRMNAHTDAIYQFNLFKNKFGESPYVLLKLAKSYLKIDKKDLALECVEKLLHHESFLPKYYAIIGDIYKKIDKIDQAAEYFEKYLIIDTKNAIIWGNLGDCYMSLNKVEKALESFSREYNLNTDNIQCIARIADCYQVLGDNKKALTWLKKAEKLDENNPWIISLMADFYKKEGNIDKLIEYLEKYIEQEPQNFTSLNNLANCYKQCGNLNKAIEYFERLFEYDPVNAITFGNLVDCCRKVGNFDKAIDYLEIQVEHEPFNAISLGNLADCYKKVGNFNKAIEYLERQIKSEPKNVLSIGNLADCFKKNGNLSKAVQFFKLQLEYQPKNVLTLGNLADCYKKQGQTKKANEILILKNKIEEKSINANYSRILNRINKKIKENQTDLEKANLIMNSLILDAKFCNMLKTEGLNLSFLKQLIDEFIENFDPIAFGQIKFGDFVRMICRDSELGVFRAESGDSRLGIKDEGLTGMELLSDLPELKIHSKESYQKILEHQNPRYIIPSKLIISEVTNTLANLETRDKNFGEVLSELSEIFGEQYDSKQLKNVFLSLINAGCFVGQKGNFPLSSLKVTLNIEFSKNPEKMILHLKERIKEKLETILNGSVQEKIIDELI